MRSLKPDVVLMDIVMPGESGLEATAKILGESPETRVLVPSMQDDPRYVRDAFAAGASGYVLKEAADAEPAAAVREVANGGRYVSILRSGRGSSQPTRRSGDAQRRIHSRTVSARS